MMNRLQALAIVLLTSLPTAAWSQTLKDVTEAHAKSSSSRPAAGSGVGDLDAYAKSMYGNYFYDWYAYNRAGWLAINKGYYDTAEHEFLSAIKAAKLHSMDDTRLIARSYADYAWALQKQGRNAEAEPLLKWALLAREATLDPNSPPIAQSLNQLATLYYDLGRYSEAEPQLRRAIDTQAKSRKVDPLEHARSQTLMGLLMAVQRRYVESEPYFRKAVALREKSQGPSHADTGDALSNLAWAYHEQGKDDEARPLFERALKILERSKGESHVSVAHVADGLGQILSKQGNVSQAEAYFLRAISIWEQFPSEGASLLEVLRHYADLLEENNRPADLNKIKARMAPLRGKFTLAQTRLGRWYRLPDPSPGQAPPGHVSPIPVTPSPGRIPG
jgi:tetratricopeptide (TPR) repeat protein